MTLPTEAALEVTQADRDAAADWCVSQPFPSKQAEAPMIRAGEYDHHSLVQAFARHRLASTSNSAAEERLAEALAVIAYEQPEEPWRVAHDALKITARPLATPPEQDRSTGNGEGA